MILACRVPVNVLFADTKSVEGAAYGHMILELPNDEHDAEKGRQLAEKQRTDVEGGAVNGYRIFRKALG